ncbi:YciI family protein [Chryseobacterium sp. 'Rf worker isolate 10']|uniref:YciI family protein n=1 Tax=Chryseobacterium sp. 'Rf worker isolate 10' TaxID=2887348 RepID=UPI003D6DE808
MKEFMFYIRNAGNAKIALSADEHLAFIKKCESYIERLKNENLLVAAQPIIREGFILSKSTGGWIKVPVDPNKEVQVGYYHIRANNIDEAIEIAKENPEFEYVPSATIEILPIKMKEEETNFIYPSN